MKCKYCNKEVDDMIEHLYIWHINILFPEKKIL